MHVLDDTFPITKYALSDSQTLMPQIKSTRAFRGHFLIYWEGSIMGQVNILNVLIVLSNGNIQVLMAYSHTLQHTEYYSNRVECKTLWSEPERDICCQCKQIKLNTMSNA